MACQGSQFGVKRKSQRLKNGEVSTCWGRLLREVAAGAEWAGGLRAPQGLEGLPGEGHAAQAADGGIDLHATDKGGRCQASGMEAGTTEAVKPGDGTMSPGSRHQTLHHRPPRDHLLAQPQEGKRARSKDTQALRDPSVLLVRTKLQHTNAGYLQATFCYCHRHCVRKMYKQAAIPSGSDRMQHR